MKIVYAGIGIAVVIIAIVIFNESKPESKESIVPLSKIVSGGPPKDGIPSIDEPKFVSANEATFMQDADVVIGLDYGVKKAYPLKILVWHEIVNDEINGIPIAVTYCPLCYTSMVFERVIENNTVEFGTSGKLYNSNLVMYDRLSDSLWSQAMGKGIAGKYSGYELKKIPFDLAYWKEWKALYPDTLVLSTDTGSVRSYNIDPYGDYYTSPEIYFPLDHRDDRLHPKALIFGLENKAYALDDVTKAKVINDKVNGKDIVIILVQSLTVRAFERNIGGEILEFEYVDGKLVDQRGNEWSINGDAISLGGKELKRVTLEPSFWFSWVAFHPDTELYGH